MMAMTVNSASEIGQNTRKNQKTLGCPHKSSPQKQTESVFLWPYAMPAV